MVHGQRRRLRVWPAHAGGATGLCGGGSKRDDVAISPNGRQIVGVGEDGRVRLWNAERGRPRRVGAAGGADCSADAFSADGSGSPRPAGDGITRVWTFAGEPPLIELAGQQGRLYDVGFGSIERSSCQCGRRRDRRLWTTGDVQAWTNPERHIRHRLQPRRRLLATSSTRRHGPVWDAAPDGWRRACPALRATPPASSHARPTTGDSPTDDPS